MPPWARSTDLCKCPQIRGSRAAMTDRWEVWTLAVRKVSIWRNRNFAILAAGQWVSQIGNTFYALAIYWFVIAATHSRADLGFVGAASGATGILGLLSGVLVDRWDRRRTMVAADAARAVLSAALGTLAAVGYLPLWLLLSLVLCLSAVGTLFQPAQAALIPAVVEPGALAAANGVTQGLTASANLLGAVLGGALLGLLGPVVLFFTNAASFVGSVFSLGLLRLPQAAYRSPAEGRRLQSLLRESREGLQAIVRNSYLRRVIPTGIVVNFALMPLNVLDVAWVRQVLHLGALAYGLFGGAILVGILTGSALSGPALRLPARTVLVAGVPISGLAVAALSRLPSLLPDLALLFVFGVIVAVINSAVITVVQRATPDELMGRVVATMIALISVANPLGALLAGWSASVAPLADVFLVGGVLMMLATGLLVRLPAAVEEAQGVEA